MQRDVGRRRRGLGRFEVHDPDPAVGLPLDPIGTAGEVDPVAAEIDLAGERDLGTEQREMRPRPLATSRNARGRTRPPPAPQRIASEHRNRAGSIPTRDGRRARRGRRELCAPYSASTCTTEPKLAAAERARLTLSLARQEPVPRAGQHLRQLAARKMHRLLRRHQRLVGAGQRPHPPPVVGSRSR